MSEETENEQAKCLAKLLFTIDLHDLDISPTVLAIAVELAFGESVVEKTKDEVLGLLGATEGQIARIKAYADAGNTEALDECFREIRK